MRLYQNQPLLVSKSTSNVVQDLHEPNNPNDDGVFTVNSNNCHINNNNNNTDNNNNGGGVASNGVKLRSKRKKNISPLSNRHSWSPEYRAREDSDSLSVENTDRQQLKNSLVKRSWTGSELKLSDIKEVTFEGGSANNLIYNRRNAISNLQLNRIASSSSSPPEKKPDRGWMGGIRRKISVTVSILVHLPRKSIGIS